MKQKHFFLTNKYPIYTIILYVFATVLVSCSPPKETTVKEEKFCIPRQLWPIIAFDTVNFENVHHELLLTGKVSFNEEKVIKVFPLASGIVQKVTVQLGDYVKKGQMLAVLSSSDIANMESELSAAESNLSVAEKNLEAAREMFKSGLTTEREYISSQKEFSKAKAEVSRIHEVLRIYSGSGVSDYVVYAPISGFIAEKKVNVNMQIRADNSDNLFTISDVNDVWIMANVYESDIPKIKLDYAASVTTLAYPNEVFLGKVDKIFNVLDPVNKVMKIRIQLHNSNYLLKPEMFANIKITYTDSTSMLVIPSSAVVFEHSKNYVVLYKDTCNVYSKEIEIFKALDDKTYLYGTGIKRGDRVISKSQLLIYNALQQQ